jgi:predicted enzyme related to lactoylglutathione lyase
MGGARIGHVAWQDVTVEHAERLRDFYCAVAGWTAQPLDMGGYADFTMHAPDGECVAGVCHARGANARLPPQWLVYITVPDVTRAAARCVELGGRVLDGPRSMGERRFCVIQDPAGAVAGLITPE